MKNAIIDDEEHAKPQKRVGERSRVAHSVLISNVVAEKRNKRRQASKLDDFGTGLPFADDMKHSGAIKLSLGSGGAKGTSNNPPPRGSFDLPGFRRHEIPEEYRSHKLVAGTTFYVLPLSLQNALQKIIPDFQKADLWQMEQKLSQAAEPVYHCIGCIDGQLVLNYDLLPEPKRTTASSVPKKWNNLPVKDRIQDQHLENVLVEGDQRLGWIRKVARAYCGWLMTESDFVGEYEQYAARWPAYVRESRFPRLGLPKAVVQQFADELEPAGQQDREFVEETKRLCVRWQLKEIVGPYLPDPLRPQVPVLSIDLVTDMMRQGGSLIYLPRNFSLMGEQELRSLLEDVVRGSMPPEHLRGWGAIAASNRQTKGSEFDRLGRLFELQHYWRILHQRWANRLVRKKAALMQSFADYYGLSFDQIKDDVKKILHRT